MFKIKDGYKLDLEMPETMKLFGRTKKLTGKTKSGEYVPSLGVVEVVLVQCSLVSINQNQKKSDIYTFTPIKSYSHLVYVWQSNLVYLKAYNTKFEIIIYWSKW